MVFNSCFPEKKFMARVLLEKYYTDIKEELGDKLFEWLCNKSVFDDYRIAELLFHVSDESYNYFMDFTERIENGGYLLHLFSGSGRLINDLITNDLINKYSKVTNVDFSRVMIDFEKIKLKRTSAKYICQDVLNLNYDSINYDIAVCHCGLRYLQTKDYPILIDGLKKSKKTIDSKCLVVETKKTFVDCFCNDLGSYGCEYSLKTRDVFVQRNTLFYLAVILYQENNEFREIVSSLMGRESNLYEMLIDLAGFKRTKLFIIKF